jgi:hypothetical protein
MRIRIQEANLLNISYWLSKRPYIRGKLFCVRNSFFLVLRWADPTKIPAYMLQVGIWTANQRGLSTFQLEWIPDILPQMRIGELRIKFEYGHQRNGQIERRRF